MPAETPRAAAGTGQGDTDDLAHPAITHVVGYMPDRQETDPLVVEIADLLWRIEGNYNREGSGRGSRFEGRTCEAVQAEAVIRRVRDHDRREAAR